MNCYQHYWEMNRPYGLEVVGDPHEAMGPGTVKHPLRPLFRAWATRSLRKQCSRAVAVAYVTRERLQRRYPCPAHSVGISDVGQIDFRPTAKVFTTNYSSISCSDTDFVDHARSFQDRQRPRILFVGSLAQMYKGPDLLIKAVKRTPSRMKPMVIVVDESESAGPSWRNWPATWVFPTMCSSSANCHRGGLYAINSTSATVFVMPSRTEGLPRAMIEAMTRALPCVGTRVGGIPELLADEDLVDPEDAQGLANKIREVVTNPTRLSEMSVRKP